MDKTILVPVSGGKDSQVTLSLALKTGRKVVCVHQNTGYDHPLTYQEISDMEGFYGVEIEHTSNKYGGMFGFLEHAQYFPNSAARGCTQRLKQEPFARWLIANDYTPENCEIWFGMRSDESDERKEKYGGITPDDEFTLSDVAVYYGEGWRKKARVGQIPVKLPVVEFTTEGIFSYIKEEGSPLNGLYAKGHHRVGCYPCFLSRKAEWVAAASDPIGRQHMSRALELQSKWQAEGNPRKFIKVHRVWDIQKFLDDAAKDLPDLPQVECGYCSI